MVYIAGPMTVGPKEDNIKRALEAAEQIWAAGFVPFVPHLSFYWDDLFSHSWEQWLAYDEAIIKRCDAVIRIPGDSKGADREVNFAKNRGIPVFNSVDEFLTANGLDAS